MPARRDTRVPRVAKSRPGGDGPRSLPPRQPRTSPPSRGDLATPAAAVTRGAVEVPASAGDRARDRLPRPLCSPPASSPPSSPRREKKTKKPAASAPQG